MKLAIIGSRDFTDYRLLEETIQSKIHEEIHEIVSGGARGADTLAEEYAKIHNIPIEVIRPEWDKYGKSAAFIRNIEIIKKADTVLAFWDGKSKGTKMALDIAQKYNKKVIVELVELKQEDKTNDLSNFI